MAMDLLNMALDWMLPPATMMFLATIFPTLLFIRFWYWLFNRVFPEDMYNKVVLITGASSGIGEQTAYEYAKKGARLSLVARREDHLKPVADRARRKGAMDVRTIAADLARVEECRRIVDETVRHYGRLDHLVNNVGMASSFIFDEAKPEAFFQPFDVTFWGNVHPTYYALPHLKQSKGRLVVNASVASYMPVPRMSIYNAANAGLVQFFDTLRTEVGQQVGVTIIMPGWVESQMTQGRYIDARGEEKVGDTAQRDLQIGLAPVTYTEVAARAIVKGAVHRKWYVTVPFWYQTLLLFRILVPEVLSAYLRFFFLYELSQKKPTGKLALDAPGAKKILYPPSIQEPKAREQQAKAA